jgi:magnesium-transporting ATPase (P-type)
MSYKIDITGIIGAHIRSLVRFGSKRPGFSDWLSFVIVPGVVAAILMYYDVRLNADLVNTVIGAFSIFVGLLLNVIVILFDIIRSTHKRRIKIGLLEDSLANISFAIVLALTSILTAFMTQIQRWDWVSPVFHAITYFFLVLFIGTVLMIINRMYALFADELETVKKAMKIEEEKEEEASVEKVLE